MFFSPRDKNLESQLTAYTTERSHASRRINTDTSIDSNRRPILVRAGSNKSMEQLKTIAKLSISVQRRPVRSPAPAGSPPRRRTSPDNPKARIVTKMSSQVHGRIIAYGVSSAKGSGNVINPHHIGMHLGPVKSVLLAESFEGALAAKIAKEEFSLILLEILIRNRHCNLDSAIYEAYATIQQRIEEQQLEKQDNSGTGLTSILINEQIVKVANAGCSHVVCETKNGNFMKLAAPHTTSNSAQLKRIVKSGGRVYQTVVNVPLHQELQVQGPLRVHPSGLTFTRCLGRSFDFKNQANGTSPISCIPEINYIVATDAIWIALLSQSVANHMPFPRVRHLVNQEAKKKSSSYSQHHIAAEASRKIVAELLQDGVPEALTCVILFMSVIPFYEPEVVVPPSKEPKQADAVLKNKSTLTYAGGRRSFIKETSVGKTVYRKTRQSKEKEPYRSMAQRGEYSFTTY